MDLTEYYIGLADSDFETTKKDAKKQYEYMKNSTARYHGYLVRTLYIPKIFSDEMEKYFKRIVKTVYQILVKVIREYEKNPEYRKLFGFDKRLEELIIRPSRYRCRLPIARIDIFFDEDNFNFKFCEFNTDGSSAMNEGRELYNSLMVTDTFRKFKKRYKVKMYEYFDSWVKEFTAIYLTYKYKKDNPRVAIVDFNPAGAINEFEQFKMSFEKAGYVCDICDICDLRYENGELITPEGNKIDVIYRRAVTCDIMEHYDEVRPFIEAVKNDDVCIIGNFKTQVVHNKLVFKILRDKMTASFLTDEENKFIAEHIPFTTNLTPKTAEKYHILDAKDDWVIKPEDSYASKGVHAGVEFEDEQEWRNTVLECMKKGEYLLQEYCPPYESTNIDLLYDKNAQYRKFSNITGFFVYNGKFRGVYSRIAKNSIISTQYSEMSLASVIAKEKKRAAEIKW